MAKFTDTKGKYLQAQSKKTRQDKSNELKESIGSLDRRVQKALSSGDTDQAKGLRSRQNKFTTKLGLNEAIRTGGVLRQGGPDRQRGKNYPFYKNRAAYHDRYWS